MSQENVEIVRRGYEHFETTGDFLEAITPPDFVWDMSHFPGWPEQQLYEGLDAARDFIRTWTEPFDSWEIHLEELHDAGDRIVAIVRQRGRSKTSGVPVEMLMAQIYTVRGGKQVRMEMYANATEALKAVGLEE